MRWSDPWQRGTANAAKKAKRGSFGLDTFATERKGRFAVAAKIDRTLDGVVFASKKEAARYAELKLLERAGKIECLEIQPSWDVNINGQKLCRYTADFSYLDKERGAVIEDVKSEGGTSADAAYRLRKRAAELYHGIRITEVIR